MKTKAGSAVKNCMKVFLVSPFIVLSFSLLFPSNSFGAVDLIKCSSGYTLDKYESTKERIETRKKLFYVYNLGVISLCLGKEAEGMANLQKSSDRGHISATHLLGLYFMANRSFSREERGHIGNLEDFNSAIHYYEKTARMIEEADNYPEGTTADMEELEYRVYVSYYVFATIPELYFNGYEKALKDTLSSQEKVSYVDTLDVLRNMRRSAERCVQRPALSGWHDKKETLYQVQQVRCGAYLEYARSVLPLEEQRIKAAQSCRGPLNGCSNHREILKRINRIKSMMNGAISSIPPQYLER